jgi:hypothetical protein
MRDTEESRGHGTGGRAAGETRDADALLNILLESVGEYMEAAGLMALKPELDEATDSMKLLELLGKLDPHVVNAMRLREKLDFRSAHVVRAPRGTEAAVDQLVDYFDSLKDHNDTVEKLMAALQVQDRDPVRAGEEALRKVRGLKMGSKYGQ